MKEVVFLIVIALAWIIFAAVQDLRRREVANWLNFSLIAFALGFRFFYCLFSGSNNTGFSFFYQGLIGLGIFLVIGNLLYYGRMFAGGDAKLMIALGAVLPLSSVFFVNLQTFVLFFLIFLVSGAIYGVVFSSVLVLKNWKNFKKEVYISFNNKKRLASILMAGGLIIMLFGFANVLIFACGVLIFLIPCLFIYAKAIEESCMVKKIKSRELREGDWLYKDVKISKGKIIRASWDGLTNREIKMIQKKYREINVKQGIPFVPVFLISFVVLIYIYYSGGFASLLELIKSVGV